MKKRILITLFLLETVSWVLISTVTQAENNPSYKPTVGLSFEVKCLSDVVSDPFTGRVSIFLTTEDDPKNPYSPRLFANFDNINSGQSMYINERNSVSFPVALSWFTSREYTIQAIMEWDEGKRKVSSNPKIFMVGENPFQQISLICDKIQGTEEKENIYKSVYSNNKYQKFFSLNSKYLSDFHKKPTNIAAIVHLPEAWFKEPERKFPVLLHNWGVEYKDEPAALVDGIPVIKIKNFITDNLCTNSENNGPVGDAFVHELIPAIEKEFRGIGHRSARFVWGQSWGGDATISLMVTYPDFFGYGWSGAPSNIDFRDLAGVNIYEPNINFYYDDEGFLRPVKVNEQGDPILAIRTECLQGLFKPGMWQKMEKVFSPRGHSGKPMQFWNRETGEINSNVADSWRKYDICYILRTRWDEFSPKLSGRLSVTVGLQDGYLLDNPVKLFKKEMETIGANIRVSLYPGNHRSYLTDEVFELEFKEMMKIYRKSDYYLNK